MLTLLRGLDVCVPNRGSPGPGAAPTHFRSNPLPAWNARFVLVEGLETISLGLSALKR